ncbi:NTF2 fold immunity protein [Volucribacter amazonae]|uniref:NTF2 fold immunity protein domain-containing protein n=1 Tax=Volucribacter amazonae TaxID=256731 RepID=A0A9X4PRB1_9PAST|nr:NTF2 fold immunity protein [Volucribacter amazonae]MDG6896213.1 hypothetical protein [Volucribacter amazonae]
MSEHLTINDELQVRKIIIEFTNMMNKWEKKFCRNSSAPKLAIEIKDIFDKYCTKKDRKYGRPNALSAGNPPNYDLKHNIIKKIEKEKNKFIVYIQQTNKFENLYRIFVVKNRDKQFKIDRKERFSYPDNKWERVGL